MNSTAANRGPFRRTWFGGSSRRWQNDDPMSDSLSQYNVVWDSPSQNESGSMPLGNGDIAVNAWVEAATGDLLLLIAKNDAWDENSINLKLGRIRVRLLPPVADSLTRSFRQTLDLRRGEITISIGPRTLRVWVDANQPVIRVEAAGDEEFEVRATLEIWRRQAYAIGTQTGDLFRNLTTGEDPFPTIISPDHLLSSGDGFSPSPGTADRRSPGEG
jgi:hypothetical protein